MQTFVKAHHKVGVLRVKEGQRNEEDIFCNCHESGHFDEFLNVLGKKVSTVCCKLEVCRRTRLALDLD